ncbi:thioesterase II family protein [Streptomyces sp. NPDC054838]
MTLITARPRPAARHRLVVFPHAGGGPSFYRAWAETSDDIEVALVHYAGREQRIGEPPVSDLNAVVAEVMDALRTGFDGRPTALFGHSMGAILAYETALALAAEPQGERTRPSALFVSARRAPATLPPSGGSDAPRPRTEAELLGALREHGGTPAVILDNPALRNLFLPALRADYQLVDVYRPLPDRPPLRTPITALWGTQDPTADAALMRPWSAETTGRFRIRAFDGGHFYLVEHRQSLLRLVGEQLGSTAAVR